MYMRFMLPRAYMYMYIHVVYIIRHLLYIKIACVSIDFRCTINDEYCDTCMYLYLYLQPKAYRQYYVIFNILFTVQF